MPSHTRYYGKNLRDISIPGDMLAVIQSLYSNCTSTYKLEHYKSQPVNQIVGLKQGCPLSPTLFNIFLNGLLEKLDSSDKGIEFTTHDTRGRPTETHIPVLAFADDILLLAKTPGNLQELLNICTQVAAPNGMRYSKAKTQWMKILGKQQRRRNFFAPTVRNHPHKWIRIPRRTTTEPNRLPGETRKINCS